MKLTRSILITLFCCSFLIPTRVARADIAPPPAPVLSGLQPFEYQTTNVQMVYERVEMEIQPFEFPDSDYLRGASQILVIAYFTMHNHGDSSESMKVIFPLESLSSCIWQNDRANSYAHHTIREDSFSILVDGRNVPVDKVLTDHPYKDLTDVPNGCDEAQMPWAGFDVTFPVDEDVVIKVEYMMEPQAADSMENIDYILETGAGWAGPIERGYVIVKFPYAATPDNVLPASTAGYQFLYNEVFWSFEDLEPTNANNIQVSIVSPGTWLELLSLKRELQDNPKLPEKWLRLTELYFDIATWHYDNLRSDRYFQKIAPAYEMGIAENPDHAELYAKYAEFKMYEWSPRYIGQIDEVQARAILSLLNQALALEPDNQTANMILTNLIGVAPSITFTPPATVPPTATSLYTMTPAETVTVMPTSVPTKTLSAITPHPTRSEKDLIPPATPRTSTTKAVEVTPDPHTQEDDASLSSPIAFVGLLVTFIAGLVVGNIWSVWRKR